jgi:hypothetical protein
VRGDEKAEERKKETQEELEMVVSCFASSNSYLIQPNHGPSNSKDKTKEESNPTPTCVGITALTTRSVLRLPIGSMKRKEGRLNLLYDLKSCKSATPCRKAHRTPTIVLP